jgi:MFS family permease
MSADSVTGGGTGAARRMLIPLALTQFVASFAGSNMNVAMSNISKDLDTTIHGVQTAITLFLLCMAALMIPGSKLTDLLGRKRCLLLGLTIYGAGAVISAISPHLWVLIIGYSGFEGVGSALMIPPIYILATMYFDDTTSRARAFGAISGMAGIGAAAGPLLGGLITTTISWRASFLLQAAIVATIVVLARALRDPLPADSTRRFDVFGAVLSAVGMLFIVLGILQAGHDWTLTIIFLGLGAALQLWFFIHIRSMERAHKEPLLSISLFRNRMSNLALVTQNVQWLLMMGTAFVVTTFLQVEKHYSAIRTGVVFTAATAGILISSIAAERFARRRSQRTLIRAGFVIALAGIGLLLGLYKASPSVWRFAPGLFLFGFGVGVMLTPSVNVVQSSFPEDEQGEISGLSRAVSNLGSSLGTAIAGTILVADLGGGNRPYVVAMIVLAALALIGLVAAIRLPSAGATGHAGAASAKSTDSVDYGTVARPA